jgi:chromosome partitioning protein
MKTIAIISEKGGAGKTITAVTLGAAASRHGLLTVLFDVDPSANTTVWGDARPEKTPQVIPAQVPRLSRLLAQAKEQEADLAIIDTPGHDLPTAEAVAPHADLIIIPCRPSPPDLVSIVPTVKIALKSGNPSFVLLTDAPVIGNETTEAREAIGKAGVNVCPIVLHSRKAFSRGFQDGLTAFEIDPTGKAATEGRALFLWACEQVDIIARDEGYLKNKLS